MLCARSEFFAAMKEGTEDLVEIDDGMDLFGYFNLWIGLSYREQADQYSDNQENVILCDIT
jgi:hypothetical protein